jgi:hypothetical protein
MFSLALALGMLGSTDRGAGSAAGSGVDLRCGSYCLYVALKALDVPVVGDFDAFESSLGGPSPVGLSMEQLAEGARAHGAFALGVETSLGNLRARRGRFVCIALLEKEGHFVCVADVNDDTLLVIDPPGHRDVARDAFEALWKGKALLISNVPLKPLSRWWTPYGVVTGVGVLAAALVAIGMIVVRRGRAASPGSPRAGWAMASLGIALSLVASPGCVRAAPAAPLPSIFVQPKSLDLGEIELTPDVARDAEFTVSNRGLAKLVLLQTSSSCGCTVVEWPNPTVSPGKSTTLRVRVKPRPESGPQTSVISILCNDPANESVQLAVRWSARYAITAEPRSLDFGWIRVGHTAAAGVSLATTTSVDPDSLIVRSSDPAVTFDWAGPSAPHGQAESRLRARQLRINVRPDGSQGTRSASLDIKSDNGSYSASLPLSWRSGPAVTIYPSSVFRGSVAAGSRLSLKFLVVATDESPSRIRELRLDGERCHGTIEPLKGDPSRSSVSLELQSGRSPGVERHRLAVVVGESDEDVLDVPLTLLIK